MSARRWRWAWWVLAWAWASAVQAAPSLFTIEDTWVDEEGRRVQLQQWRGKPTVVAMEYSACRFVCSVYWRRLVQTQEEADKLGLDLQFVILSIDPENDSPAQWRDYRKARDLKRRNWHFLTSTRPVTTRAAALLGVRWWYDQGHLMHDFRISRLAPDGRVARSVSNYDEPVSTLLNLP